VSFAAPLYLLGLLLLPAAVLWYARRERRRRVLAQAFVSPELEPSVIPRSPGLRRHVGMLCLLIAAAGVLSSLARPRITRTVADDGAAIILATDVSGSMLATDVAPNRVTAAQHAANTFTLSVPASIRLGVIEFNQSPTVLALPSTDRLATIAALGRLQPGGGTAAGNAIQESVGILSRLRTANGRLAPGAVVLLSDGKTTSGANPLGAARDAASAGIPIYTVALGTPGGTITVHGRSGRAHTVRVPPDPGTLAAEAELSGGKAFSAGDAASLRAVYQQLGAKLGRRTERHQVGGYFLGSALALVALGSAASLVWFGRLI